jgi:3'-phosphoadenosine 5'-phosphosulfate sulfotransferase (PAPS reductase)/FAD synthetase
VTHDPFKIDGPTCISFSGGRTSAYMLWRVLQSNGGLPADAVVCFANTGKEEEATLRFVRECSQRWAVPIIWVEYRNDDAGFAVVDFETASRDGEPFAAMIAKEQFLPSPVQRICTSRLKVRVMHKMLRARGWTEWDQFIGIRADEPRRTAKIRARPNGETSAETMCMPLADAGVAVGEVDTFWTTQPFALDLATFNGRTLAGNCDLCFLKPASQVQSLISERPSRAIWWVRMEALAKETFGDRRSPYAYHFSKDRPSYAAMLHNATAQQDFIGYDADEEAIACFCGE